MIELAEETLAASLDGLFSRVEGEGGIVAVLGRQPNRYASTFGSEIVTCMTASGKILRLLCKRGPSRTDGGYGHRGGLAYEATVHRLILEPSGCSTPRFYGAFSDERRRTMCLVLEYLEPAVRVTKRPAGTGMRVAAEWIGRFHAEQAGRSDPTTLYLNAYDRSYYIGWAERTRHFARHLRPEVPWLDALCRRFVRTVDALVLLPRTVIHGEYYPHNVLVRHDAVYPVDWETAALAPGEIDLASLTDGWPGETARRCEIAYQHARWPAGAPEGFETALNLARIYLLLRWLGDRPEWTKGERARSRLERLRATGERLEMI